MDEILNPAQLQIVDFYANQMTILAEALSKLEEVDANLLCLSGDSYVTHGDWIEYWSSLKFVPNANIGHAAVKHQRLCDGVCLCIEFMSCNAPSAGRIRAAYLFIGGYSAMVGGSFQGPLWQIENAAAKEPLARPRLMAAIAENVIRAQRSYELQKRFFSDQFAHLTQE